MGLHYLPVGKNLITRILSQMNNNRLLNKHLVDITQLMSDVEKLLKLPTNYEIREGKTFIKSLNRFRIDNQPVAVQ